MAEECSTSRPHCTETTRGEGPLHLTAARHAQITLGVSSVRPPAGQNGLMFKCLVYNRRHNTACALVFKERVRGHDGFLHPSP